MYCNQDLRMSKCSAVDFIHKSEPIKKTPKTIISGEKRTVNLLWWTVCGKRAHYGCYVREVYVM